MLLAPFLLLSPSLACSTIRSLKSQYVFGQGSALMDENQNALLDSQRREKLRPEKKYFYEDFAWDILNLSRPAHRSLSHQQVRRSVADGNKLPRLAAATTVEFEIIAHCFDMHQGL